MISRVNNEQNGPSKFSQARSHELNDAYMNDFDKGFEELRLAHGGEKTSLEYNNSNNNNNNNNNQGYGYKTSDNNNNNNNDNNKQQQQIVQRRSRSGSTRQIGLGFRHTYDVTSKHMVQGWKRGPTNPAGNLFDASDRNILCMSLFGKSCVIGSADHGLKEFNIETCKMNRNLYTKKFGHSEWVTCVTYVPDGRILSGGMDSKICLWNKAGSRCNDLTGHSHSVSCIVASNDGKYALSGSYDKSIRVWNLSGNGREAACLMGHQAPIMCMEWSTIDCDGNGNGYLLSGAMDGMAVVWDLGVGSDARILKGHKGHITAVEWISANDAICLTGAQDGIVQVWDANRINKPIFKLPLHRGGAVNDIVCPNPINFNNGSFIATCGADSKIHLLDPRKNFQPFTTMEHHKDFIYAMSSCGDCLLSGGGDGILLVHDMTNGKLLYGLGANQGAVRCIAGTGNKMIAAGDDGNALVYEF